MQLTMLACMYACLMAQRGSTAQTKQSRAHVRRYIQHAKSTVLLALNILWYKQLASTMLWYGVTDLVGSVVCCVHDFCQQVGQVDV